MLTAKEAAKNPPEHKLSKGQVEYTDYGHEPEYCYKCMHWLVRKCDVVSGAISARGWCHLWHK